MVCLDAGIGGQKHDKNRHDKNVLKAARNMERMATHVDIKYDKV